MVWLDTATTSILIRELDPALVFMGARCLRTRVSGARLGGGERLSAIADIRGSVPNHDPDNWFLAGCQALFAGGSDLHPDFVGVDRWVRRIPTRRSRGSGAAGGGHRFARLHHQGQMLLTPM